MGRPRISFPGLHYKGFVQSGPCFVCPHGHGARVIEGRLCVERTVAGSGRAGGRQCLERLLWPARCLVGGSWWDRQGHCDSAQCLRPGRLRGRWP